MGYWVQIWCLLENVYRNIEKNSIDLSFLPVNWKLSTFHRQPTQNENAILFQQLLIWEYIYDANETLKTGL